MSDDVQVPCGREWWGVDENGYRGRFICSDPPRRCPNCIELLALRARVAELEATAARRLECIKPFATAYDAWVAADSDTAIEITPDQARAAATEVAAEKGGDRG